MSYGGRGGGGQDYTPDAAIMGPAFQLKHAPWADANMQARACGALCASAVLACALLARAWRARGQLHLLACWHPGAV